MKLKNIVVLDETGSTNKYLKNLINDKILPDGFVVAAKYQTEGKGQTGNEWLSEPGKNLTLSILLKPAFLPADHLFLISKAVSLAMVDYLNSIDNHNFKIKWPNDIYYNDKKIAGILIENQILGDKIQYSVVGIGLNINQVKFNSTLPNPISMATIFNREFDVEACTEKIVEQISIWYELLDDGFYDKINEMYFANLYRTDSYYDFTLPNNGLVHAKIVNVDNDGLLTLKTAQGQKMGFYFKEIEFTKVTT